MKMEKPLVSLGIIADVQYGDIDDTVTYGRSRFYRSSLDCLQRVCSTLTSEIRNQEETPPSSDHRFSLLNLGDLIEGFRVKCFQTKRKNVSMLLDTLEQNLPPGTPMYHVYGNHELYGLLRVNLHDMSLNTARTLQLNTKAEAQVEENEEDELSKRAHSNFYSVELTERVRLVCLDLYDESPCGFETDDEQYVQAMKIVEQARSTCKELKQKEEKQKDEDEDEDEEKKKKKGEMESFSFSFSSNDSTMSRYFERFAPHGGAAGKRQLEWLRQQLAECRKKNKKIVMAGHIPLRTECANVHVAWNAKQILDLIRQEAEDAEDAKEEAENNGSNTNNDDDDDEDDCEEIEFEISEKIELSERRRRRTRTRSSVGVLAYLGGHHHYGGYFVDELGIHHVTVSAILETPPPQLPESQSLSDNKDENANNMFKSNSSSTSKSNTGSTGNGNLSYGMLRVYEDRIQMCNVSSYHGNKGSFTVPFDSS